MRGLLGVLLLADGVPVAPMRLARLVWGEPDESVSVGAVQVVVSRLRSWLRDRCDPGVSIEFGSAGYVLRTPGWRVDSHRFVRLLDDSVGEEPARRCGILSEALSLWRGEPLADVGSLDRVDPLVTRLCLRRIDVACALADVALAVDRCVDAVELVAPVAAAAPLHEPLHAALMLLQHAAGRQADAVATFKELRGRLADELGLDPGAQVREAYAAILRSDIQVPQDVPAHQPWHGPAPFPPRLHGRDRELAAVGALVGDHRVVTVVGQGGSGKTALALHAADRIRTEFPAGVTVVALASVADGNELPVRVGSMFGLRAADVEQLVAELARKLADNHALLVLDNVEHLVDDVAVLVSRLVGSCPGLWVLATSRLPIRIPGEAVFRLPQLALPEADGPPDPENPCVALFRERADQARPERRIVQGELALVVRICRRLDGLPLALELAAARVSTLSLDQLADCLDDGLAVLDAAPLRAPDGRQRTMQATIGWSYDLLPDDGTRRLYARLSVFCGQIPFDAVAAICAFAPLTGTHTLAALVALVDHGLVQANAARSSYRLMQPVREHAARLLPDHEEDQLHDRYIGYWSERALDFGALPPMAPELAARELTTEIDDLRAAIDLAFATGRDVVASEMVVSLWMYWVTQSERSGDAERWLRIADARADRLPEKLAVQVKYQLATLLMEWHGFAVARSAFLEMLPLAERHMTSADLGQLFGHLAAVCREALDPAAFTYSRREGELAITSGEPIRLMCTTIVSTHTFCVWGRYSEIPPLIDEHRALVLRHWDDGSDMFNVYRGYAAEYYAAVGKHDEALVLAEKDWSERLGGGTANQAEQLRRAYCAMLIAADRPAAALEIAQESLAELARLFPLAAPRMSALLIARAEAERRCGEFDRATASLLEGLRRALHSTQYRKAMSAVLGVALLSHDVGDLTAANDFSSGWDALRRDIGLPVPVEYSAAAATILGLDPAASAPGGTWHEQSLRELAIRTRMWCAGRLANR